MSTFFSLIIPAYNSEKFISKCLQSVLNQNFSKKKYEIIIVDDASKDSTFEICEKFKKKNKIIRILCNKKNYGVSQGDDMFLIIQRNNETSLFFEVDNIEPIWNQLAVRLSLIDRDYRSAGKAQIGIRSR